MTRCLLGALKLRMLPLVLAVLLLVACQSAGGGSDVTVIYPKASGLEIGDELRMSDFAIGKIAAIELEPDGQVAVRIELQRKYESYVTEGSRFRIRREALISADRYIELEPGEGGPVADGTRFVGELPWEERLRSLGQGLVSSTGDADLRAQLEELSAAAERAAKAGREEWEARRPELEAEAQALLERLQKEGGEAADRLQKKMEEYLEELEEQETGGDPKSRRSQTI